MTKTLSLMAALVACHPTPTRQTLPSVRIAAPAGMRAEYMQGARAWATLGFDVGRYAEDGTRLECYRHWYRVDGDRDCQLTIGIVIDDQLIQRTGSDAASSRDERRVSIHPSLLEAARSRELVIAIAHEVGHIVLDTPSHTAGGVMGARSEVLSRSDFELACKTIGVCR